MEPDAAEIQDYDEYYKSLFDWFLQSYIRLFYSFLVPYIDFNSVKTRPNEFFFNMFPGLASRRFTDFIAEFHLTPAGKLRYPKLEQLLFLVEPEKGSISDLRPRMHLYHTGASQKYPKAHVFLTGLYIDTAFDGIGYDCYLLGPQQTAQDSLDSLQSHKSSKFDEPGFVKDAENVLLCSWPYVGLPGLRARNYLKYGKSNPIVPGLIGFMRIEPQERQDIFVESFLQISKYKIDVPKKRLLARGLCMGMKLSLEEEERFKKALLEHPQFKRNDKMIVTLIDKIEAEGEAKGNQKLVLGLLRHRFGSLPQQVLDQVKVMKPNQLEKLSVKLLNASNGLKELGLANGAPPK